METIHKYPINVVEHPVVRMPSGAVVLHVDQQGADPRVLYVWAIVDTNQPFVDRQFRIVGTGRDITGEHHGTYIGTTLVAGGAPVRHVFDMGDG